MSYKKINVHNTLEILDASDMPSLDLLYDTIKKVREENPGKELNWMADNFGIQIFELRPETDAEFNLRIETSLEHKRKVFNRLKLELGEV